MTKEINSGVNMYDFNRANMGKLPVLTTPEELAGAKGVVTSFLEQHPAKYYMLLNHENKYFTVFNFANDGSFATQKNYMAQDVIECMENCDFNIIDICPDNFGGALEVWVKDLETESVHMYLLFPYDFGVIEY